jgi:hypothetical protein
VTKNLLLKKLENVMTEAERSRMYGEIQIILRNGEATVLRTLRSEQLDTEKNSYAHANDR